MVTCPGGPCCWGLEASWDVIFSPCAVGGKVIGGVIDCFLYETAPIYYLHLGVASVVVLALVLPELGL